MVLLGSFRCSVAMLAGMALPTFSQQQWKLLYEEDFSTPLNANGADWFLETYQQPFDTVMDDAGDWYKNDYGPAFTEALNSFDTYRKEFKIGQDGWLTASFSARDSDKDGVLSSEPTLEVETIGSGLRQKNVLTMTTLDHTGGVILRPTNSLPETYRIEYKLTRLDYGGKREGSIVHPDGKINGYSPEGCKTQHPWGEGSQSQGWSGDASAPYCEWQSVRSGPFAYNGFHFLAIVDFPDPAPRNNHFWHLRRKVLMDSFSQHPDRFGDGPGGRICNANSLQYYNYSDSSSFVTLNMWISSLPGTWTPSPGGLTGNAQRFMTDCNGGKATSRIQSAGELLTSETLEPDDYYTFAIERNASGYTLEASGRFARVEHKKLRFFRPFVEDDEPIWHYNVKSSEYNGEYNGDLRQDNWAFGSQTWPDQWPAGSAYPDWFVIGKLYTNVYEGSASVTDIRLYVPDDDAAPCAQVILLGTNDQILEGETISREGFFLEQRSNGALEIWTGSPENPCSLYWDNGINESIQGATYVSKLQGDGNLITRRRETDGSSKVVWKTSTANNSELYSFVVECQGLGGGVALYEGTPGQDGVSIWARDSYLPLSTAQQDAPSPVQSPTFSTSQPIPPSPGPSLDFAATPQPEAPSPVQRPVCLEAVPLMGVGGVLYSEEESMSENDEYCLYQNINGNLELWEGRPDSSGRLLWESGQQEATIDIYYTTLQSDSNLVTTRVMRQDELPIWQTGTSQEEGVYKLVLDRCEIERLAIKNGMGEAIWSTDLLVPLSTEPASEPSVSGGGEDHTNNKGGRKSCAPTFAGQSFFFIVLIILLSLLIPSS
jgi:hypothetical protein